MHLEPRCKRLKAVDARLCDLSDQANGPWPIAPLPSPPTNQACAITAWPAALLQCGPCWKGTEETRVQALDMGRSEPGLPCH